MWQMQNIYTGAGHFYKLIGSEYINYHLFKINSVTFFCDNNYAWLMGSWAISSKFEF